MSFFALVARNLLRQKTRAGLTTLGITVGIATVIALGVITQGFKAAAGGIITARGSDFIVAQKGAADLSFSIVPEDSGASVSALPGVAGAEGALIHVTRAGSNPFFFIVGVRAEDLAAHPPRLTRGRPPAPGAPFEILLGEGASADLDAPVGASVTIDDRTFTVTGIYTAEGLVEKNGAYAPLATVQEMAGKVGVVSILQVRLREGADLQATASAIEDGFPNLVTITNVGEYGKVDQGVGILDAMNIAISVLAVGIGGIGVMNTMVMSVFERTREIGILRAVGWSGLRVLRMIVVESVLLCTVAAVAGSVLGIAAAELVTLIPAVEKILVPQYDLQIFGRALGLALTVALLGAAYPAYRALRLSPLAALRYE